MHFEDILERMGPEDDLREPVERWVRKQRLARNPRTLSLERRVKRLRRRLRAREAELEALTPLPPRRPTRPLSLGARRRR
jgi:hypothetical protein